MENPTKYIMAWGIGLGTIALFGLVMIVLFGNLDPQALVANETSSTITITNESADTATVSIAYINQTGYTLDGWNSSWGAVTFTTAYNRSASGNYNVSVLVANISETAGVVRNTSTLNYNNASLSYTYAFSWSPQVQQDITNYNSNYTSSILNTGEQFPTVGTILGVALLLVILISILVYAIRKMAGVSGGSGGGQGTFDRGDFG